MTVGLRPRYSPVVQLVERWTVNPYVAGSSPARGATFVLFLSLGLQWLARRANH